MLDIIADGLSVLYTYKEAVIVFFITTFGIGFFSTSIIVDREVDVNIRIMASFGVGSILLCLVSFVFIVLSHFFGFLLQFGSYATLLFAVIILLKGFWSGEFQKAYTINTLTVGIALFFLLLVRLAFLKHIILPSYSDSPIHYQIVYGFLHPEVGNASKLSLPTIFDNYYHYGFHSLATWLTSITGFEAVQMISLIGQLLLVTAPLSILCFVYALTYNRNGALFAGLLAAVGWLMPAFSINWGKFPALAAMAVMPVVALVPLLFLDNRIKWAKVIFYGLLLWVGNTFIHTRIIICLVLVFASFFVIKKLQFKGGFGFFQSVRFTLLVLISLWPVSDLVIDFYNKMPILIMLLILMPFAFQSYPAVSTGIFVFLSGLSLVTLIPNLLSIGGQALLDRQFLAMTLYMPLSIMGGLGFGGLVKKLDAHLVWKWIVVGVFVVGIVAHIAPESFFPDRCCNYFKENDRFAFHWIQNKSSSQSLYFISTFRDDNDRAYGTDAGIWISPLTMIATNRLPFNTKWNSTDVLNEICSFGIKDAYIYMGGREFSFDNNQLSHLIWVSPVFRSGEVVVYKISGCTQ